MTKSDSKSPKGKGRYNLRSKKKRDDSSDSSDASDSEHESEVEEIEYDSKDYHDFLSKLFPSVSKKDLKELDKKKKKTKGKTSSQSKKSKSTPKSKKSNSKKSKSKKESDDEESSEYETIDSDEEDDSEESDEDEMNALMKDNMRFNIVFTVGGKNLGEFDEYEEDSDEDEDEDDDEYDTEDEISDEDSEEDSEEESDEESEEKPKKKRSKKNKKKKVVEESEEESEEEDEDEDEDGDEDENDDDGEGEGEGEDEEKDDKKSDKDKKSKAKSKDKNTEKKKGHDKNDDEDDDKENSMDDDELLEKFKGFVNRYKKQNTKNPMIKEIEKMTKKQEMKMKKKEKKQERKTKLKLARDFGKAIKEKGAMNDFRYFKERPVKEQKELLAQLIEVNKLTHMDKPYRISLLETNISPHYKSIALRKINSLRYMDPGSGEYYKLKNWVDTFMKLPFDKYNKLSLTMEDGIDKCHSYMEEAKLKLDSAVYGLNDAKMQIMQMVGQWIANPQSVGNAIAIKGPMGTGKTTLVKEGISTILGRPFAFIALGGATDSSFLEGHSYTYEGSTWGKIVDIIIASKCMNPVIYFDELDKVSDTPKGEEIIGILTHLIDTTQNTQFHDKYFADIDFDLSKALFIFSYNDEKRINRILLDRMYRIQTKGYDKKEKCIIANNYVIPAIEKNVNFEKGQITIPEETLHYIIDNYTDKEEGVRNFKRCIEIIYTKLNLFRLMKTGTNLFEQDVSIKVEFPFTVSNDIVDKLIKRSQDNDIKFTMYL
tara:strand:- start:730 stop:3030 length:2301 start_codon:yes stop_codon:yes gene_type:complete